MGLALVAGALLAAWGVKKEPARTKRWTLWGLRLLAALCVAFFLAEPGLRRLQLAQVKNRVAVLVDRSASMGFPVEPGGKPRSQAVAEWLGAHAAELDALKDKFIVELYGFDPELSPVSVETLQKEPASSSRSDLLSALRSLKAGEAGGAAKKLSGAVLLSDGTDNVELAGGATGRAKSALEELGIPVSTVLVGREALRDLAIDKLKVDDFSFVRNSAEVELDVRALGLKGETVPVVLRREGKVIATKSFKVEKDDELRTVSFSFTPDQTGRFVYTVTMPVFADEAVTENNSRSFALKVIRDRIRVLLVVGRPTWDERFLRGLLKQDPNVDLVSFYILRTQSDNPMVSNSERELSLIPFPMDEIFDIKLSTFDVVVFQNFGYSEPNLSLAMYEDNLERYVHNGGALVMIGGDRSFGEGRLDFQVLGAALPVDPAGGPADLTEFRARLTPEGQRHPVTALGAGGQGTAAAWASLPAISGANMVRPKPGATVLLDHPHANIDGKSAPLLALWDYGRGRSMALMTDGSWSWAFAAHAQGEPSRHYNRFWANALRWLVRDPELTTLRVTADPPAVEPGKPVGAVVAARLPDYQPAAEAEVKVELFSVEEQKAIAVQTAQAGSDGTVRVEFPPPPPGAYKLLGTAKKGERSLGEGEDAVAVRVVGQELSDASVRPQLLSEIARLTGGKALRLSSASLSDLPLLEPPVVEVGRSQDQPLWDRWYYLVLMVGLLGLEWALRRRFGYV